MLLVKSKMMERNVIQLIEKVIKLIDIHMINTRTFTLLYKIYMMITILRHQIIIYLIFPALCIFH